MQATAGSPLVGTVSPSMQQHMVFATSPTGTLDKNKPKPPPPKRTDSLISEEILPPKDLVEVTPIDQPDQAPAVGQPAAGVDDYSGLLDPSAEREIMQKWIEIVGPEFDVLVAQISKFKEGGGLGISLEG